MAKGYTVAQCIFCGGKMKVYPHTAICATCGKTLKPQDVMIAVAPEKSEQIDIDALFICDSGRILEKLKQIGVKAVMAQILVPSLLQENERVFCISSGILSPYDFLYNEVTKIIFQKTQRVSFFCVSENEFSIESKLELNTWLKTELYKSAERSLEKIDTLIPKIPQDKRAPLIEDFRSLKKLVTTPLNTNMFDVILEEKLCRIVNAVFDEIK